MFNFRSNGLQISVILTFEIFGHASNHGKNSKVVQLQGYSMLIKNNVSFSKGQLNKTVVMATLLNF